MRNILEILGQLPNGSNVLTPINPAAVLKVRRKGENMYWKKIVSMDDIINKQLALIGGICFKRVFIINTNKI